MCPLPPACHPPEDDGVLPYQRQLAPQAAQVERAHVDAVHQHLRAMMLVVSSGGHCEARLVNQGEGCCCCCSG